MRLHHPNIIDLHNFEQTSEAAFLIMEYAEGRNLLEVLADSPDQKIALDDFRGYIGQICAAIAHAHDRGVVHGDIKPTNVLVMTDGRAKVLDFGVARVIRDTVTRAQGAARGGTPYYMAPELHRGEPPSPASDQYALAVMCYELLTGKPLFASGDVTYQHLNVPPPRLTGVPRQIADAVERALAKRPAARWSDIRAFRDALFGQASTPTDAPPKPEPTSQPDPWPLPKSLPRPPGDWRRSRRRRLKWLIFIGIVWLLIKGFGALVDGIVSVATFPERGARLVERMVRTTAEGITESLSEGIGAHRLSRGTAPDRRNPPQANPCGLSGSPLGARGCRRPG